MLVLLAVGFRRLDKGPAECPLDTLKEKDQLLSWLEYWYWEDGDGNIIASRPDEE